ncbi:hypothetical protein HDU79_011730, partial [Rhizoclosmatium sp. JEL0117]
MVARTLNLADDIVKFRKAVLDKVRTAKSSEYRNLLPLGEYVESAKKFVDSIDLLMSRVKRSLMDSDYDDVIKRLEGAIFDLESTSMKLVASICDRLKFINLIVTDFYPGADVVLEESNVQKAVDNHYKKYPKGKVILFTEKDPVVSMESRIIMQRLIQKYASIKYFKFIICLEAVPLIQSTVDKKKRGKAHTVSDGKDEKISKKGNITLDNHPYELEKECQGLVSPLLRTAADNRIKTAHGIASRLNLKELFLPCQADVTVMILGASGGGKSTFINAFFNYILFNDFDDAMENCSKLFIPIPGQFTANGFGRRNSDNKIVPEDSSVISFGTVAENTNENINDKGQSATQDCKMYTFTMYNRFINFIDAPGMLDSRGIEQDKKNSDHIVSYLSSLPHLSAVLFVLKPNEERMTPNLMYTFVETFSRL